MLYKFGWHFKFATAFGKAQVLGALAPYRLGLEFHREYAPLQLRFLDDFQCVMLRENHLAGLPPPR